MRAAALPALCACGTSLPAGDAHTGELSVAMLALAHGDGTTTITVHLSSDMSAVVLEDSARLTATDGVNVMTMVDDNRTWTATLPTDAGDTPFAVSLTRPDDTSAPRSAMSMPYPFAIAAPPSSASRAADLTITWSPPSSEMLFLHVDGDCITSLYRQLGDTGSLVVPAGSLALAPGATTTSCTVMVVLERVRDGMLDPHFSTGGPIQAMQARSASFTTTP